MTSVLVRFLYATYTSQGKISVCMQGSGECCPVCVRIPELSIPVSTAVWYAANCGVTSRDTSTGRSGTFPGFEPANWFADSITSSIYPKQPDPLARTHARSLLCRYRLVDTNYRKSSTMLWMLVFALNTSSLRNWLILGVSAFALI